MRVSSEHEIWLAVVSWPPTIRLPTIDDDFVVGESLSVRLRIEERADQIVASLVGPGVDHPLDVDHEALHRSVGPFDLFGIHEPEHRTQGIRVPHEVRDVVVGHPQEATDHANRDLREGLDEVSTARSDDVVEGRARQVTGQFTMTLDRSGREHPGSEPPEPVVGVTFVGEHELRVPGSQGTVRHTQQIEERQADPGQPDVVRQAFHLVVSEHHDGATQGIDRGRPRIPSGSQLVVDPLVVLDREHLFGHATPP